MEILYTKSLDEFYSSNDDMCFYYGHPIFKESAKRHLELLGRELEELSCMEELKIPLYELKRLWTYNDGPFIPGYELMMSLVDIREQLDILLKKGKRNIVYCCTIQNDCYMFIHVDHLNKMEMEDCLDVSQSWLDEYKLLYVNDFDFTYWLINEYARKEKETYDLEFHGNIYLKKNLNDPIVINEMEKKKEKLRRLKRLKMEEQEERIHNYIFPIIQKY